MQVTSIVSFLVPTVETLSCMGCGTISSMALAADIMSAQTDFHQFGAGFFGAGSHFQLENVLTSRH